MKINELNNIKFEGYVWLSNSEKPIILPKENVDFSKYEEGKNPFIVEALLYSREQNKSVIIRHTGKYHIYEYDLNNLPDGAVLEDVEYLPHRLDGVKKVCFKQLWLPEEDENCEKMKVLKMKALIFTGFDCKTDKN
jgi:CRISPR type III-associated protein (TIGR04423 family)